MFLIPENSRQGQSGGRTASRPGSFRPAKTGLSEAVFCDKVSPIPELRCGHEARHPGERGCRRRRLDADRDVVVCRHADCGGAGRWTSSVGTLRLCRSTCNSPSRSALGPVASSSAAQPRSESDRSGRRVLSGGSAAAATGTQVQSCRRSSDPRDHRAGIERRPSGRAGYFLRPAQVAARGCGAGYADRPTASRIGAGEFAAVRAGAGSANAVSAYTRNAVNPRRTIERPARPAVRIAR